VDFFQNNKSTKATYYQESARDWYHHWIMDFSPKTRMPAELKDIEFIMDDTPAP